MDCFFDLVYSTATETIALPQLQGQQTGTGAWELGRKYAQKLKDS